MRPGATIGGGVSSTSGRGLGGVCVVATTPGLRTFSGPRNIAGSGGFFLIPVPAIGFGVTAGGRYQVSNLQPGQYEVAFVGGCGSHGDLAAQWYSAAGAPRPAAIISPRGGDPTFGINPGMAAWGGGSCATKAGTRRH